MVVNILNIYSLGDKQLLGVSEYPFINLVQQNWDDYGRKTLFSMWVHEAPEKKIPIGKIKIISSNESSYDKHGYIVLPPIGSQLLDEFASLGQDLEFYSTALSYFKERTSEILNKINDLGLNVGLREEFEHLPDFRSSLIRFSEAEKALHRARNILENVVAEENFDFRFACKIGNAASEHSASFNFNKVDDLPHRIIAVIGENGTGKTQYLSKLALALSGEEVHGEFSPKRPLFSKIIAVSYSAFDQFRRPKSKRTFSYKYCGLKDDSGFMSSKKLEAIYSSACDRIVKQVREDDWFDALGMIIDKDILEEIGRDLFYNKLYAKIAQNSEGLLSSGQSILMYVITEILASVREDSLILFDEPEMHLHPHAISNMVGMVSYILKRFKSYAVIATHSPIILQEIPSRYVRVFERTGAVPNVRAVEIETFGENIANITKNVFSTGGSEEGYKEVLRKLAKKHPIDVVEGIFEGRLSMNASIFLKGCYSE